MTLTMDVPYVEVNGERIYATLKDEVLSSAGLTKTGIWETTNNGSRFSCVLTDVYVKNLGPNVVEPVPTFVWPKEVSSGLVVNHGNAAFEATHFSWEGEEDVTIQARSYWNENYRCETWGEEIIQLTADSSNSCSSIFNWYPYRQDLIYKTVGYYLSNTGKKTSVPKKLVIEYADSDILGAAAQDLLIPENDANIVVTYTTTANSIPKTFQIPEKHGKPYKLTASNQELASGEYFKRIEVVMSQGYPAGYMTHDSAKTFIEILRALTPEELANGVNCENFVSWKISNVNAGDTDDIPAINPSTGNQ